MSMVSQAHATRLKVKVAGRELADEPLGALVSAVVDQSLRQPDMFVLTFRDPGRTVLGASGLKIASEVELSMLLGGPGVPAPLMTGEVTALEAEVDELGSFTVVRGYDKSHRMQRGRRTRSFVKMKVSSIVSAVASEHGLAAKVDATTATREHTFQHDQSDWEFLQGLARDVGYDVVVKKADLEFRKPAASTGAPAAGRPAAASTNPLQLVLREDLISLRAAVTAAEQAKDVTVRGWDPKAKKEVVGKALATTTDATVGTTPAALSGTFGNRSLLMAGAPYDNQGEAETKAKALMAVVAGTFAEVEGVARGNPALQPGAAVAISEVGTPFDGKYTLSATRHEYDPIGGYTVQFTASGRGDRSLLGLASGRNVIPAERPSAGWGGGYPPAIAIVTNNRDPEKLCRVKLKFPWLDDAYETDWARVAYAGAGASRGSVILPEVNDEVLVVFDQGDAGHPVVIGGLFNGKDKPHALHAVVGNDGKVTKNGHVTRTGAALSFVEEAGKDESIKLMTSDDKFTVVLDKTKTTITVDSGGKVLIKGATDVSIEAGANLNLKGGANVTVEASASLELKGATVKVQGSGPVQVKGTPIQLN